MRGYIKHVKTQRFRKHYRDLPHHVQRLADKSFELLKQNPQHPSLALKKVNIYWASIGRQGLVLSIGRSLLKEKALSSGFGLEHTTNTCG